MRYSGTPALIKGRETKDGVKKEGCERKKGKCG